MHYSGWYSYNEEKQTFGFNVKKQTENYIFGEGKDDGGAFSLEVKINPSCFLTMRKIYHGAHTVGPACRANRRCSSTGAACATART